MQTETAFDNFTEADWDRWHAERNPQPPPTIEGVTAEIERSEAAHRPMLTALVADLRAAYAKHLTATCPVDPGQIIDLSKSVVEVAMEDWDEKVNPT